MLDIPEIAKEEGLQQGMREMIIDTLKTPDIHAFKEKRSLIDHD